MSVISYGISTPELRRRICGDGAAETELRRRSRGDGVAETESRRRSRGDGVAELESQTLSCAVLELFTLRTGSVQKIYLLDSCFCRFKQTDRQKKRPECTLLAFHFPPTTFVYLLYRCEFIHFVAKRKKTSEK